MLARIHRKSFHWMIFLAFLMAWEFWGRTNSNFAFVASTPSAIGKSFITLVWRDRLVMHFFVTALEATLGVLLGLIIGFSLGLAFWYSAQWAQILRPYVTAFSSVPLFALAPLMILWFGVGFKMKVALACFATTPLCLSLAFQGALAVSDEHIAILRGLGATRMQTLTKAVVPGALVSVIKSMRVAVGLGLLGAFMGEFITSERGLGHLVLRASGLYDVSRALAATIGIVVLALVFDRVGILLENRAERLTELLSVPAAVRRFPLR